MHRVYLAATMGFGLGSDDPEELEYYKKLKKEMEDMKKDPVKKGIPLSFEIYKGKDKWIWILFLIDGILMLIGLPFLMIFKGKKNKN